MPRVLNYLPHPIRKNGFFPDAADKPGSLEWVAQSSQATYNLMALIDPRIRLMEMSAAAMRATPVLADFRVRAGRLLFVKGFASLGFDVEPGLTLNDALLSVPPAMLTPMLSAKSLRESPFFRQDVLRNIVLLGPETRIATDLAALDANWTEAT